MPDEVTESTAAPRCPWCSSELPSTTESRCPTCGAILVSEGEPQVPGVTSLDPEVLIRGRREAPKRSRLLTWITGESDEPPKPGPSDAVAPPPLEVRREMLKMELEAEGIVPPGELEAGAKAEQPDTETLPAAEALAATNGPATDEAGAREPDANAGAAPEPIGPPRPSS